MLQQWNSASQLPICVVEVAGKGLGVASAIIIASCIKENGVLKELKCAARPKSVRFCVSAR